MDEFEVESVRIALRRMFEPDRWFDICTVDECLKTAGVTPPIRDLQALRPLHCVKWAAMSPAMRIETLQRVLALFSHPKLDLSLLEPPGVIEQRRTFLQKLLA